MAKLLSNGVDGLCIMVELGTGPQLSAPNHRGRAHGWQTHEVPHVEMESINCQFQKQQTIIGVH